MATETEEVPVHDAQTIPAQGAVLTPEALAMMMESHFCILCVGILTTNGFVPRHIMFDAIASGMGRALSGLTQGADIKAILEARDRLGDLVNKEIRKAYPALNAANINAAIAETKKVGGIIIPH